MDFSITALQISLVELLHRRDLQSQSVFQDPWQHCHTMLLALAVSDCDFIPSEIDILHPQTHRLHDSQARAIQQSRDQTTGSPHVRYHSLRFFFAKDDGQSSRMSRPLDAGDVWQLNFEHLLVKKEQGIECLILGGGCDSFIDGEMSQERAQGSRIQLSRMLLTMKENVSLDPVSIGLFSSQAEMPKPSNVTHLIEQLPLGHR